MTTSCFKIYDDLYLQCKSDIHNQNKLDKRYCATINRLPHEHRNIIFLLIYHHYVINILNRDISNSNNRRNDLPYNGKIGINGKGVSFDGSYLPIDLQRIIIKYLDIITH